MGEGRARQGRGTVGEKRKGCPSCLRAACPCFCACLPCPLPPVRFCNLPTRLYIFVYTYMTIYIYVDIHTYIHTYIQTDRHTYIHTYIHTYFNTSNLINSYHITMSQECNAKKPSLTNTKTILTQNRCKLT